MKHHKIIKRIFDIIFSIIGLIFFLPIIVVAIFISKISTGLSGIFRQERVGLNSQLFKIYKIRSVKSNGDRTETSNFGEFIRKSKIDELPQLWNILIGDMSFVGPRPDVPGFADRLKGEDRIILSVRPGLTGPASIKFKNEEIILAQQQNPAKYNREVIWPKKVEINKEYITNYSFFKDIYYILISIF